MDFVITFIACLISFILGGVFILVRQPVVGTIHIDTSDPKTDRALMELQADPRDFMDCNRVTVLIDTGAHIKPFAKEQIEESQE